jgi:hypothetical protein
MQRAQKRLKDALLSPAASTDRYDTAPSGPGALLSPEDIGGIVRQFVLDVDRIMDRYSAEAVLL